jgi:hypothetical protein
VRCSSVSTAAPRSARLEAHRQRLEHAAQHERQRLEAFDRPLEFERRVERLVVDERHERRQIVAAGGVLPARTERAEPGREIVCGERRQLRQRADAPAAQHVERALGVLPRGVDGAPAAAAHPHAPAHVAAGQRPLMGVADAASPVARRCPAWPRLVSAAFPRRQRRPAPARGPRGPGGRRRHRDT